MLPLLSAMPGQAGTVDLLTGGAYHQCCEVVAEEGEAGLYDVANLVLHVQEVVEAGAWLQVLDEWRYALQHNTRPRTTANRQAYVATAWAPRKSLRGGLESGSSCTAVCMLTGS